MTRVVLDLAKLVADGHMTAQEAERLEGFARQGGGAGITINILSIFGALSVAAGVITLEPSPVVGLALALLALVGGAVLIRVRGQDWAILAHSLVIMGCIGLAGWAAWQADTAWPDELGWVPNIFALVVFTVGAVVFRQPFLAALAPFALGTVVGSGAFYWFASYAIFVREAFVSAVLFCALAAALYALRQRLADTWHQVLTIAARVSIFMVHMAFWVGSLWGDHVGQHWISPEEIYWLDDGARGLFYIPESVFSLGWLFLIAAGIYYGTRTAGRFLANTSIVFLSIHAYTQYFETFGLYPASMVLAGLGLVGIAFAIARFDRWLRQRAANPQY